VPTTPISGKNGKVTYGGSPTTVAITDWSLKLDPSLIDVSNTTDGRARIAGLGDVDGSFKTHVDTASTYEADLAPGTSVTLKLYTDGTKCYTVLAIMDAPDITNKVDGTYDITFNFKLNGAMPTLSPA